MDTSVKTASIAVIDDDTLELHLADVTTTIDAGDDPVTTATDTLRILAEAGYQVEALRS